MAAKVRFVLNRGAFASQVLSGPGTTALLAGIAAASAGGEGEVVMDQSGPRSRARVYGSLNAEATAGALSRVIGGMRT